jgi:hypothetical protein
LYTFHFPLSTFPFYFPFSSLSRFPWQFCSSLLKYMRMNRAQYQIHSRKLYGKCVLAVLWVVYWYHTPLRSLLYWTRTVVHYSNYYSNSTGTTILANLLDINSIPIPIPVNNSSSNNNNSNNNKGGTMGELRTKQIVRCRDFWTSNNKKRWIEEHCHYGHSHRHCATNNQRERERGETTMVTMVMTGNKCDFTWSLERQTEEGQWDWRLLHRKLTMPGCPTLRNLEDMGFGLGGNGRHAMTMQACTILFGTSSAMEWTLLNPAFSTFKFVNSHSNLVCRWYHHYHYPS